MELHQLECFIAVAQNLNFTEAARQLHIVQSAVSHNIAELEKELDVKLFVRKKHAIELTSAGEYLLKESFNITSQTREASILTKKLGMGIAGKICIGYVFEPIVECMIDSFKKFYVTYPNVKVNYNSYDSITISRMLDNFELDIAFARIITVNNLEKKHWIPLYTDPLYVVVSGDNPLSKFRSIDTGMLKDHAIILMNRSVNPGMFDMVIQFCMNNGFTPRIIDTANDLITPVMMAEIGQGVVILPGQFKRCVPDNLLFIPLNNKSACHEISVVWHKDNPNPAMKLFLKQLGINSQNFNTV